MCIFRKRNGTHVLSSIPFKNLKKFLDMSKITTNKTVLQRNGKKNSHVVNNNRDTEIY